MKGFLVGLLAAGLVCLAMALGVVAQAPQPAAPAGRVVLFNLAEILQKYDKAKDLTAEEEKFFKDAAQALEKDKSGGVLDRERRRKLTEQIIKRKESNYAELIRDVAKAAESYAKANGVAAVLSYIDPIEEKKRWFPANVMRKVEGMDQSAALVPFYIDPKADVTTQIVDILNRGYAKSKAAIKAGK